MELGRALERLAGLSQILDGFFGAPSPTSLIDSLPEPPSGSFEDRIQNPPSPVGRDEDTLSAEKPGLRGSSRNP